MFNKIFKPIIRSSSISLLTIYSYRHIYQPYVRDQNIKKTIDSSYELKIITSDTKYSYGMGFLIKPKLMVTNYHVIDDMLDKTDTRLIIRNKNMDQIGGKLVHADNVRDLALIELDEEQIYYTKLSTNCRHYLGKSIYSVCLGNSDEVVSVVFGKLGIKYQSTEANRSTIEKPVNVKMVHSNLYLPTGFSGSALCDIDTGKVLGINDRSYSPADLLSSAILSEEIIECVDEYEKKSKPKVQIIL